MPLLFSSSCYVINRDEWNSFFRFSNLEVDDIMFSLLYLMENFHIFGNLQTVLVV